MRRLRHLGTHDPLRRAFMSSANAGATQEPWPLSVPSLTSYRLSTLLSSAFLDVFGHALYTASLLSSKQQPSIDLQAHFQDSSKACPIPHAAQPAPEPQRWPSTMILEDGS